MRVLTVGDAALLVEVADTAEAQAAYRRINARMGDGAVSTPRELVPAARTVLLDGLDDVESWRSVLVRELSGLDVSNEPTEDAGREVTIRVRYDGPDLEEVAAAWGCRVVEVVRRHLDARFTVAFCGFAPGFAYCTGDPALPDVPRRSDPAHQGARWFGRTGGALLRDLPATAARRLTAHRHHRGGAVRR